ncbi:MAG: Smr/MutS family protein [Bacilli bacterium]|nr:Smr/MutS family protein [Bacilli bacterium]
MINSSIPTLDLHGEYKDSAIILTQEFINDNIILKNEYVLIIHGIGSDILRKSVHEYLRKEKKVLEFKRDFFNPGCTIVKLKIRD